MTLRKLSLMALAAGLLVIFSISYHSATVSQAQDVATPPAITDWQLTQKTTVENGQKPDYTITISRPTLDTNGDTFNKAVDDFITSAVSDFKKSAADTGNTPITAPSTLNVDYDVFADNRGIISVRFNVEYYIQGAAHPASYSHAINYDANASKVLALADLFKPNSKYLDFIAKYASDELKREDRLTFPEGAAAKEENYASWTIDHGGLLITFDEDQVGPHAAGPSFVFIPYTALGDLLTDNGMMFLY